MKQKLRILTLSFLLVMQSFFGLAPITLAENSGGTEDEIVVVDEGNNEGNETEEGMEEGETGIESDEGTTESDAKESESDENVSGNKSEQAVDETENNSDEESTGEGKEAEETLSPMGSMSFGSMAIPPAGVMPPEDVMKSTEFTVGGQTVVGTGPVTVQNGQTAQFKFNLELEAGHKYGPGTTMTYTLPEIFTNITFPQGTEFGDLGEITKNGNEITITFNDNIHDGFNGTAFEPGAHFYIAATFNNTGNNVNEKIDLPGQENIALNFTPLNGKPITKENGVPKPTTQNSEYIEWKVTVNTDLKASGTVEFKDTLTATNGSGHKFDTNSVTITELTVKPDGNVLSRTPVAGITPFFNGTNTEMTINLDGTKAYEITYHTIPDDPGNNDSVTYLNSAQYGTVKAGTKTATVNYGTPLSKEYSGPNANLETTWTIKYNHNKRTISQTNANLMDTWSTTGGSSHGTAQQEMVANSFEIRDGNNQLVSASPSTYTMTPAPDGQGFELQFHHEVTDAYTITYKTKPTSNTYITSNMTVKNKVTRNDINITREPSVTYSKNSFMLNKSATGSPNYQAKTMDWTITANQAKYALAAGTTFTDTFTNTNLTLKENTLVVKDGNMTLTKDVGYTLTNSGKNGFTIQLTAATSNQITITYTTDYDIKDIGSNDRTFANSVAINNSGLPVPPSDSATHSVAKEQTANGKKDGKYNYATKEFEWEVEVNFNYNTLTNAIFEDVLPATQTIDNTSIRVVKGTLNSSGTFVPDKDEDGKDVVVNVPNSSTDDNRIILNLGSISTPHKIYYESYDTDGVFPETSGKVQITNTATLKDGSTSNASWKKTVGVNYTDKLITKKGSQIGGTAGIKWNFEFNYAQSNLRNIVITDTVGKDGDGNPNQLIKADSFKVSQVALSGKSDSTGYEATKQNTVLTRAEYQATGEVQEGTYQLDVNIQAGTFKLKLPDGNSAYYVEYETIYMGDNNSTVTNEVQVNYVSNDGNQASNNFSINNFKYGNAGTTVKVPFVVLKTDGATGEPLEGVEFTLYSQFQPGVALISKKTDANGVFDLGMKLTGGNYTLEETGVLPDYDKPANTVFKLDRNLVATSGPYAGKQVVEIENFKTGANVCTEFTLTVKDVDRNVVANKNVTLTNKATGQKHTIATNNDGEITLYSNTVKAGTYTITINEAGSEVTLGEITVTYSGDCQAELQPQPKCPVFTITIEDKVNKARPNVTVTLKHKTDTTAPDITAITDANGQFTVPSATTQTGKYKVYEGKQYLGDVTITYKNTPCEAVVTEAPACEVFTLIVKDVDGNHRESGVNITIKDKDGNTVTTETTDSDGKVTIHNLPAGEYEAYEENSSEPFAEFTTNPQCEVEVQPEPACPDFTITVNDENGNPRKNVAVTVKNLAGNEITAKTTNDDGNITVPSKDLPAGTYEIYEGGIFLGEVEVSYKGTCEADVDTTVANVGTCPIFELAVLDRSGKPQQNVQVTVKDKDGNTVTTGTTDNDGKVVFPTTIGKGTYNVYDENDELIGSFTVENVCEANVKPAPLPSPGPGGGIPPETCELFTVTVKQDGVEVEANTELTFKSDTTEVSGTTDADGKIIFEKNNLPEGAYQVYDKDGRNIGTMTVTYAEEGSCSAEVNITKVETCEQFTIVVKEAGKPVTSGSYTFKSKDGETTVTGSVDSSGKLVFGRDNLPAGEYEVYEGDVKLADLTVSYKDGCQTVVIQPEPNCDFYTIKNRNLEEGTVVTLKGANNFEEKATVTKAGEVQFASNDLPAGEYEVIIAGELLSNITVSYKNSCSTTIHQLDFEEDGKKTFLEEIITKQQCTPQVQPIKDGKAIGEKRPINKDGVFATEEGEHEFAVTIECEGEEEIVVGKITVDEDGKVKEELIDPYGKITVCVTNEILGGVEVELYYADTQRNRDNGRTPGTLVDLPSLPNFGPNFNANPQVSKYDPQWSDVAGDYATYAWMVHPETDYYIALKKEGYASKISETISVEYDIVKRNFCMEPYSSSGGGGGNSGGDTPGDGNEGGKTPEDGNEGGKTPEDGNEGGKTPGDGKEEGKSPRDGKEEGNTPGDGNEEGKSPGDGDQEGNTPTGGNQDGRPDVGSKDKTTNLNSSDKANLQASEDSLPQTGEERNLLLLFVGITSIMIGAMLISMRRKTKAF